MRLALIAPPQPYLLTHHTQVPLGLLYLSAVVKRNTNWEVEVIDYSATIEGRAGEDIGHFDVYGFTATSLDFPTVLGLKHKIKAKYPDSKYIIGGPHVTACPEDGAKHFDCVFTGEAERALGNYLQAVHFGVGWAVRQDGATWPVDVTRLPYPDRDALSWKGGQVLTHIHDQSVNIMASRGCPWHCAFCASQVMWPGPVRWRTPHDVVAEIRHCIEKYDAQVFRFSDDNMTSNRIWAKEFCKKVKPLQIKWRLSCRVDRIDTILLEDMKAAGCEEMGLGIESFDQNVLDALNKKQWVGHSMRAVYLLHDAGIGARLLLMFGTPGETFPDTYAKNKTALGELRGKFVYASMKMFMPLPGTPVWDKPEEFGVEILSRNLSRYNFYAYHADDPGNACLWSPIRINGMTDVEQKVNAGRMFAYMDTLPQPEGGRL